MRSLAVGGIHLASGSTDETIRLYDILNQVESGLLTHHSGINLWDPFHTSLRFNLKLTSQTF